MWNQTNFQRKKQINSRPDSKIRIFNNRTQSKLKINYNFILGNFKLSN